MTKTQFETAYPEFADGEFPAMIDAALVAAEARVSDTFVGALRDQIVALECAHALAITPFGRNAKLSSAAGESTYGTQAKRIRTAHVCAIGRQG